MRIDVSAFLLIGLLSVGCTFPSRGDVDDLISRWNSLEAGEKQRRLTSLLSRLSSTDSATDDATVKYAFAQLSDLYDRTDDELVVAAVDATPIFGGFANEACYFYWRVIKREKSLGKVARTANRNTHVCIGITLEVGDVREHQ